MKKLFALTLIVIMIFLLAACSNGNRAAIGTPQSQKNGPAPTEVTTAENKGAAVPSKDAAESDKKQVRVASDGARMQTNDPTMATRVLEGGTKINMHFGNVVIPGTLNDSITAQDLISKLPYTVHVNRYSHDFCGVMTDPLKYRKEEVHYGWLNGDIDFATDANYFTILFEDEKVSEKFGYQVNIGKIDCKLSEISKLTGSYDVLIELARTNNGHTTSETSAVSKNSSADEHNSSQTDNTKEAATVEKKITMNISIGNTTFTATLENNDTAKAFAAQLPLTVDMSALNGNEKYSYLSGNLRTDTSSCPDIINEGDLMLYGNNCLVLFYKTFNTSYSYVKLGHTDNTTGLARALGSGSVKVTFSVGD